MVLFKEMSDFDFTTEAELAKRKAALVAPNVSREELENLYIEAYSAGTVQNNVAIKMAEMNLTMKETLDELVEHYNELFESHQNLMEILDSMGIEIKN